MADPLSDVLNRIRLRTRREDRMFFTAPWGYRFAGGPGMTFILVGRGACTVESHQTGERIVMSSEDIALVSGAFDMHDGTGNTVRPFEEFTAGPKPNCQEAEADRPQGETWILASNFTFEGPLADAVTSVLGSLCHIRSDENDSAMWLQSIFRLISKEACQKQPGSEFAHSRILELYFLQFLRAVLSRHVASGRACTHSLLKVLFDPQLSGAIERIHRDPGRDWSVAELAASVSMSRTAFAVRFAEVAGIPPLAYVTRWRMIQATDLLDSGSTLEEAAPQVGYESAAAFSRAFKREFGISPGAYRRYGVSEPMASV